MKNENPNLLVITSYPQRGKIHGAQTTGIASYAKNTILSIKAKATVLAEVLNGEKGTYIEEGIRIKRVWRRGSILSFPSLLKETLSSSSKTILFEFELSMFGGIFYLLPLPLFLFINKIFGKRVIIVFHQVISNLSDFSGHLDFPKKGLTLSLYNLALKIFYFVIITQSDKTVVFEEALKQKLEGFSDKRKIVVIPHGVEEFDSKLSYQSARKALGIKDEFIILCFGYIAHYKGTDWIVNRIKNKESGIKNVKLIIAGGANPNHGNKKFYMKYVRNIEDKAKESKGKIIVTGFVKEENIPLYFKASDLVVFPYRTLMSSSGPLSLAFSFNKPFLISKAISDILKTGDFNNLLRTKKIREEEIVFEDDDVLGKIENLANDKNLLAKLSDLSKSLKEKRSWRKIGEIYYEKIFS